MTHSLPDLTTAAVALYAPTHADRMRPDAKTCDFSMPDACILCKNYAENDATGAFAGRVHALEATIGRPR